VSRSVDRLVRVYADGSGARVLVGRSAGKGPRAAPGRAAWSPDGKLIAFAADLGVPETLSYKPDLFVMRADGSQRRRLTKSADSFAPVWSPDGQRIYFARHPDSHPDEIRLSDGRVETPMWISSIRPDGTDQRDLTSSVAGRFEFPGSFSPDGAWLAFTRGRYIEPTRGPDRNTRDVWVMRPDGSDAHKLADRAEDPAFSPDGHRIAFASDRDENGWLNYGDRMFFANELYTMDADGPRPRRLTRTRAINELGPSWMPNGSQIAYHRGKQYQNSETMKVFRVNADGSCARTVAASPGPDAWPWYTAPAWRRGDARKGDGRLRCRR
jgi:Tol biopolymer transport system component